MGAGQRTIRVTESKEININIISPNTIIPEPPKALLEE